MSAPSANQNDEIEANVKPPTKKRGRKRKSEILAQKIEEIIEKSPEGGTVSRRGRPRKKVNYYELANPDNVEDFPLQQIREQERYFNLLKEESIEKNKKKRVEKDFQEENITKKIHIEKIVVDETTNKKKNNVEAETHANDNINLSTEAAETEADAEPSTSTPKNKDKKYNYTGETVKMMSTLFNFFSEKSDRNEADESTNLNSTNDSDIQLHSPPKNGKRRYTKHKKVVEKQDMELDDSARNVTCAVCNAIIDKQSWRHHKQKFHNNLAWRIGDSPLNLNDQTLVMKILNSLYREKKSFKCYICGEAKKSVVGFLSHRSQCSKSENQLESVKISCEICGRKMLPVSLSTHMKIHLNPTPKETKIEKKNDFKPLPSKRSAAKKAKRIIENATNLQADNEEYFTTNLDFNNQELVLEIFQKELADSKNIECKYKCNQSSTDLEDALEHFQKCPEKVTEGFACKKCLLIAANQQEIVSHLDVVHSINLTVPDDNSRQSPERPHGTIGFLKSHLKQSERKLFGHAFKWTWKFHEENDSKLLFEKLLVNTLHWRVLPQSLVCNYLPNLNESCQVARRHIESFINPLNESYTFKKYKLFESELHNDNKVTIFCGGPVSSLAWLPTPFDQQNENQVLAASVLSSPDNKYVTSDNFFEKGAIQFWDFGCLNNREKSLKEAEFLFGLAVDFGPIWHMEWCPSGCYSMESDGRMGLLAVTGADSIVYIYAVPRFNKENSGLFYKAKPSIKLILQQQKSTLLGGYQYYPTKLSWSKARGHDYIAVGYSNGLVALYNLNSSSKLLLYLNNEVMCILPSKCFQAHSHAISALTLYHLNGGCRWLLTASFDRDVCIWDLQNYSYPVHSSRKNIVTDGVWLTNWLCNLVSSDEGSTGLFGPTVLNQVRDFGTDPNFAIFLSHCTVSAVSASDWLNGLVHVNTAGEILGMFPHQILRNFERSKVLNTKRMLFGYTYLIEKGKTPEQLMKDHNDKKNIFSKITPKRTQATFAKVKLDSGQMEFFTQEPLNYEDADKKYSVLFCDNQLKSYNDFPKTTTSQLSAFSKSFSTTAPNQYPLIAINKVAFNPNRQASLYFATGYQAGFVRVMWLEFLKNDEQIK